MTNEPPGKQFHAQVTRDGQVAILTLSGELDISTVRDLAEYARPVAESAEAGVVVDLTDVRFLSSSAITELVRAHDHLPASAAMALVAVNNRVALPIQLSGIDRVMSTFADLPSAVGHIRDRAQAARS
jgi:anti-sigma B factor antagonist